MKALAICPLEVSENLVEDILTKYPQREFKDVVYTLTSIYPIVHELGERAYVKKDPEAWSIVQKILYKLNRHFLTKGVDPTGDGNMIRYGVRGMLLKNERKAQPRVEVNFTDRQAFKQELIEKIESHPSARHPLFDYIKAGKMTLENARCFIGNYQIITQIFHMNIAIQSYFSPFELRGMMYENLNDEFGNGDPEKVHMITFDRLVERLELPKDFPILDESYYLYNKMITLTAFSEFRYGLGALGALEFSIDDQLDIVSNGLSKLGLNEEEREFFTEHIEIDVGHGNQWLESSLQAVNSKEDCEEILNGALEILDARNVFLDGVWKAIQNR